MVPFVFSKATNLRFLAPFALATEKQTAEKNLTQICIAPPPLPPLHTHTLEQFKH